MFQNAHAPREPQRGRGAEFDFRRTIVVNLTPEFDPKFCFYRRSPKIRVTSSTIQNFSDGGVSKRKPPTVLSRPKPRAPRFSAPRKFEISLRIDVRPYSLLNFGSDFVPTPFYGKVRPNRIICARISRFAQLIGLLNIPRNLRTLLMPHACEKQTRFPTVTAFVRTGPTAPADLFFGQLFATLRAKL